VPGFNYDCSRNYYIAGQMKILTFSLLCFFINIYTSNGQSCNCPVEISHAKSYIELNYAGFKDKVTDRNMSVYQKHTREIMERAKYVVKPAYCIYLVNEWLEFFRDEHLETGANRSFPAKGSADLQEILKGTETIQLSAAKTDLLKKATTIEGIYWSPDSADRIAVIKSNNGFREYAGIILQSRTANWKPGMVKIELKAPSKKNLRKGITYFRDHTPKNTSFELGPNTLGEWQREGTKSNKAEVLTVENVSSRSVSKQTFYIKIGTFNQRNAKNIDSLFTVSKPVLDSTENLILDLRNNGGGADFSYKPIVPYLYTGPIKNIGADLLAGEGNIAGWKPLLTMNDLPADSKTFILKMIQEMEKHKNEFIKLNSDDTLKLDHIKTYPKKIVILINKGCGSTTEEFLLAAKQSSKVTMMGTFTGGVLDYANVRETSFTAIPYALRCPTSRSRRLNTGEGIDNIGIKPDYLLKEDQNWITEARHFLEGK
jgi:hypothetical protein